jgi:hypothetical protein
MGQEYNKEVYHVHSPSYMVQWCMIVHFGHVNLHMFIRFHLHYRTFLFQLKITIVAYIKSQITGQWYGWAISTSNMKGIPSNKELIN